MVRTNFILTRKILQTGNLQIDEARTALFSYLYARHMEGQFILSRNIRLPGKNPDEKDSLPALVQELRWLGLDWDEGPDQTPDQDRLKLYHEQVLKLLNTGHAYRCFCTPEDIKKRMEKLPENEKTDFYDGHCRNLTTDQIHQMEKDGKSSMIRFVETGAVVLSDPIRGKLQSAPGEIGDFILVDSGGNPADLFADALENGLREITHVFCHENNRKNSFRQSVILRALNFNQPVFIHLPSVMDNKQRLLEESANPYLLKELEEKGYLPESLFNALSLLGWSSPDGREVLGVKEMIRLFDLGMLSAVPARFDRDKLNWIAKHYVINEAIDKIFELALPFLIKAGLVQDREILDDDPRQYLKGIVQLTRGYCSCLSEIQEHVIYFLKDTYEITKDAGSLLGMKDSKTVLEMFKMELSRESAAMDENVFSKIMSAITRETGIRGKNLFMPLRAALTGRTKGPEIYYLIPVIGKERTLKRIDWILGQNFQP